MKKVTGDDQTASLPGKEVLNTAGLPEGVDRRAFLMRSAVLGAASVIVGCSPPAQPPAAQTGAPPPAPADLDVVKKSKGPVMTVLDEFYKVGPGPSSSHTIGPMRITYDFYQRCTKLPAAQLARRPVSRSTCTAASAPPAKATAPSAPRWRDSSARSRPRSTRCSSTR
jgi:hypothetical protein